MRRRPRITLLAPDEVLPHEKTDAGRVKALIRDILAAGAVIRPVIVDAETMLLVDGHHRLAALKLLGARAIPAVIIDYPVDVEKVIIRRPEALGLPRGQEPVFKGYDLIGLRRMISSLPDLLPPRTTYHITWAKRVVRPYRVERLL